LYHCQNIFGSFRILIEYQKQINITVTLINTLGMSMLIQNNFKVFDPILGASLTKLYERKSAQHSLENTLVDQLAKMVN
jgi:hypothetical protein